MKILIYQLEDIEDPRSGNATVHNLADILFIAIAATVADADPWYEVVDYAKVHEDFSARIAGAIRSHWRVENQLHWVLDVGFNEDASMKREGNAAENFARLRRIALNLIRHDQKREGGMNKPLKRKRKAAAWSTKVLECILFSLPYEQ